MVGSSVIEWITKNPRSIPRRLKLPWHLPHYCCCSCAAAAYGVCRRPRRRRPCAAFAAAAAAWAAPRLPLLLPPFCSSAATAGATDAGASAAAASSAVPPATTLPLAALPLPLPPASPLLLCGCVAVRQLLASRGLLAICLRLACTRSGWNQTRLVGRAPPAWYPQALQYCDATKQHGDIKQPQLGSG